MRRFFGLRLLLLLPVVAVLGGFLWLRSSLPQEEGRLVLPGLVAEARITRDEHGIPTIAATSDRDAAFALGFVHAQDRLFQMDTMRRYGAGRLSEWFGAATLRADRFTRTLGLYRAAEQQYALLTPELRAALDAYAAGVNAYLARRQGALPPEYQLLRAAPEPWRPADTLVWGKLMDLQLAGNFRSELLHARLAQHLSPEELAILYPPYPHDAPVALGGASASLEGLPLDAIYASLPGLVGPTFASNNWVVDGMHSVSGKPLLANDPHLGFSAPSVWYLARIETPGARLDGVTAPGGPFIIIGHNAKIAWGFTTTGGDVEDLFVERVERPGDLRSRRRLRRGRCGGNRASAAGDVAHGRRPFAQRALGDEPRRRLAGVPRRAQGLRGTAAEHRLCRCRRPYRLHRPGARADPRPGRRLDASPGLERRLRMDRLHPVR